MEAVRTSETSVDNHFTRQYNPEDNSEQLMIQFPIRETKPVCPVKNPSLQTDLPLPGLRVATHITSYRKIYIWERKLSGKPERLWRSRP
jgi:hypothetical protein